MSLASAHVCMSYLDNSEMAVVTFKHNFVISDVMS